MIDILGKRYIFFAVSLILILPGMVILAVTGLPLAIDFTGGSMLEVQFPTQSPPPGEVFVLYNDLGVTDVQVTPSDNNILIIRSKFMEEEKRAEVLATMEQRFNTDVTVLRAESVGPTIGEEVTARAAMAIGVSALLVILYITFAFRGIPNAFRYGVCAIIAMVHDFLVVMSLAAIGGLFFGWQMDSLFLTALLTVIGFSVQDKIVVFDRIRENSNIYRKLPFEKLANHSIIQTLGRSINTQLMTSEFMLLALALFGGVTLREFAIVMLVGLFMGTYSSIFIAAPFLVLWENREWKHWFKRNKQTMAA